MSKLHAAFDLRPFLGALCMVTKSACEGLPLSHPDAQRNRQSRPITTVLLVMSSLAVGLLTKTSATSVQKSVRR